AAPAGIDNLWFRTFDAQAGCDTARSPESLMGNGEGYIQARFPKIYAAELNQRRWETCIKTTTAKGANIGRITMMRIDRERIAGRRYDNIELVVVPAEPK
ncbi:MAG: hypothetical protein JKY56_27490, partial [Kofleriaceae bacterium]|nr:hypothetical protein [Kofleriaceae bacterium]